MRKGSKERAAISGMTAILFLVGCFALLPDARGQEEESTGGDSAPVASAPVPETAPETVPAASSDTAAANADAVAGDPDASAAVSPDSDATAVKATRDPFCAVNAVITPTVVKPTQTKDTTVVPQAPTNAVDWVFAKKQLKVTGYSPDGKGGYFAVVNGQVVGAGDNLPVSVLGSTYVWVVLSISREKGLQLSPLSVRPERKGN